MINCLNCDDKCYPVYKISSFVSKKYVCRGCALEIMKEYYDRRPDEIEKTD
mgnify:CR=1 FL=1|tara:strand:+ start:1738 stop:1890 length:153 start_codon:yes stop_codon:yes gene_type:complete